MPQDNKNLQDDGKCGDSGGSGNPRKMSLTYSAMTLLPYSDEAFSGYQSASAQEARYGISQQIQANIILK